MTKQIKPTQMYRAVAQKVDRVAVWQGVQKTVEQGVRRKVNDVVYWALVERLTLREQLV